MSLQTARTSSQSAEDVRLFTYVTIFFVPLSFSSSLFSMGGAPERSTISVMIPTTMIALAITIFALVNIKVLDRNLRLARKKIGESKHSWGLRLRWNKILWELEEAAELRLAKPGGGGHLRAQSRWWFIGFWISYALKSIRNYMLEGFRMWDDRSKAPTNRVSSYVRVLLSIGLVVACALILIVRTLTLSATDSLSLVWQVLRWLKGRMMGDSHPRVEEVHEKGVSHDREKPREVDRKSASIKSVDEPALPSRTLVILLERLEAPPRPLKRVISKLKPPPSALDNVEPQISGPDTKVDPLIQNDGMHGDKDNWEMTLEQYLDATGEPLRPDIQPEALADRRTSDGSFKEKPSWWMRLKNRKATESRV
ncbi:MAG: hypothetical protein Q9180_005438 [Flavoplaca navasiana]